MTRPFSDSAAFFTRKLDLHPPNDNDLQRAMHALIRLFISWLPQGPEPKFVLKHPDYDLQNILVAADRSVIGIIDWDKVFTEPRCNGNEQYPLWLMSDWDPAYLVHTSNWIPNTKEELLRYRAMYQNFLTECKSGTDSPPSNAINMTKVSLVANILEYTACQMGKGAKNLFKIMREISIVAANDPRAPQEAKDMTVPLIEFLSGKEERPEQVALSLTFDLALRIDQGTISENEMGWLRDGFAALFS